MCRFKWGGALLVFFSLFLTSARADLSAVLAELQEIETEQLQLTQDWVSGRSRIRNHDDTPNRRIAHLVSTVRGMSYQDQRTFHRALLTSKTTTRASSR